MRHGSRGGRRDIVKVRSGPHWPATAGAAAVILILGFVAWRVWQRPEAPRPAPSSSPVGEGRSTGSAAAPPDLSRDVVLAGSNTIGGHLAGPLLLAFANADGDTATQIGGWTATDDWRQASERLMVGDKLQKCRLNAHPDQQLEVTGARERLVAIAPGSGCGAPLVNAGFANVAMLSRPINDAEKHDYATLGPWTDEGLAPTAASKYEHVIAMDGVVVIANPGVRPQHLTKEQVRLIFQRAGGATNWKGFGGPDIPIQVMSRDNVSGTYDTFKNLVMDDRDLVFASAGQPGIRPFSQNAGLVEAVKNTPGAIGFAGLEYASEHPELVVPIAECGLDYSPVGPLANWMIKTEDYPLARRLFLYTPAVVRDHASKALAFIEFVESPLGQQAVRKANFVSLDIVSIDSPGATGQLRRNAADLAPVNGVLAQKYRTLTLNANELTATIRFGFNQAELDARARDDLKRIADFMRRPENRGSTLVAAGFADRIGPAAPGAEAVANVTKADQRAGAVAEVLRQAGVAHVESMGFASEAPVGCNGQENEIGRRKNRRVELWLRRPSQAL